VRVVNPDSTITVKAPFDGDDVPAEFDIAVGIVGDDRAALLDMQAENDAGAVKGRIKPSALRAFFRECVRVGLRGIRHFKGLDGNDVALVFVERNGRRVVADSVIRELEMCVTSGTGFDTMLNWVGAEIWQRTTLTAEQKKTFDDRLKSVLSGNGTPALSGTTTTPTTVTGSRSNPTIN
jgi:hypothetical protein